LVVCQIILLPKVWFVKLRMGIQKPILLRLIMIQAHQR
jgi:hypothetical protein